jgi:D-glycero-alpha-D-manno-heptose-7-phosphate kinase
MVISRTPFRISFFGGGTDFPQWYRQHGGLVISTTINKYCYLNVRYLPPFFDYKYRIRYANQEYVNHIDEIAHPSVRECIRFSGITEGLEVQHNADVPAMSGLGSSASFTAGLLNALRALQGRIVGKRQLAAMAIDVDQHRIGECVGSQDQVAAAFGGLNMIAFGPGDHFEVTPLTLAPEAVARLECHLMLFFTGFQRIASEIAAVQIQGLGQHQAEMMRICSLAREAFALLQQSPLDMAALGGLLDEQWQLKSRLSEQVSTPRIQEIYRAGVEAGAYGGKLLGAGGGGFILFLAAPELHEQIRLALAPLLHVPVRFEQDGSRIIYYAPEDPGLD